MISDLDIYRSANAMISQYGSNAALETAQRADALMEKGDIEGQRVWRRILAAVNELQNTQLLTGARTH